MDPLDIAAFDSLSDPVDQPSKDDAEPPPSKTFHDFDDLFGNSFKDSSAPDQPAAPKLASAKGHNLLFSFDESPSSAQGDSGPPPGMNDLFAEWDGGKGDEAISGGLFDDLLDFSPSAKHVMEEVEELDTMESGSKQCPGEKELATTKC